MIDKSFLKQDLIAIPFQEYCIQHYITPYEYELFKFNLKQVRNVIFQNIEMSKASKIEINHALKYFFKPEEYSFYYQMDELLSFDEYLFLEFIQQTRTHKNRNNFYLFPVLHYANTPSEINNESYKIFNNNYHRNIDILQNEIFQYVNEEFLIDYAYPDIDVYAFTSGFVPKVKGLSCIEWSLLEKHIQEKYSTMETSCLTKDIIQAYSYILFAENQEDLIKICLLEQSEQINDSVDGSELPEQFYKKMWSFYLKCPQYNQNIRSILEDVWQDIIKKINQYMSKLKEHLKQLENYLQFRMNNNKEFKIAKILIDYQKIQIHDISNSLNILDQFIKQKGIIS